MSREMTQKRDGFQSLAECGQRLSRCHTGPIYRSRFVGQEPGNPCLWHCWQHSKYL